MRNRFRAKLLSIPIAVAALGLALAAVPALAAEKLVGLYSARVMSQSMPWIAQEAGLFQKYNLDFDLVFIASSGMATAAILGGDVEVILTGGVRDRQGLCPGQHGPELYRRR